jgi:hypothetical protein
MVTTQEIRTATTEDIATLAREISEHTTPIRGDNCFDDWGFTAEACERAIRKAREAFGGDAPALTAIGFWMTMPFSEPDEVYQTVIDANAVANSVFGEIVRGVIDSRSEAALPLSE